ncbi:MAG: RimK/LysX family protein [Candidatus Woesearchaeota archaeon]
MSIEIFKKESYLPFDMKKITVGLVEKVKVNGEELLARVDTGAEGNSVSQNIAKKLSLGPVVKTKIIKSSSGRQIRPIVMAELEIGGKKMEAAFNITDRAHMKYPVLIGRAVLKDGFMIDPSMEE